MKEKYLPIGTVVLLKNANKKLMINGYCSMVPTDQTKIYDYVGCLFPEGNIGGEDVALFDHEQIAVVEHMGLVNEEYKEFNVNLINVVNEETIVSDTNTNDNTNTKVNANSFISEDINNILQNIDVVKEQILGPSSFDEESLKVPSFEIKSPSVNSKVVVSNDDVSVSVEEDAGDGSPVLQLEPILVDQKNNNDNSSNSGSIFDLERL